MQQSSTEMGKFLITLAIFGVLLQACKKDDKPLVVNGKRLAYTAERLQQGSSGNLSRYSYDDLGRLASVDLFSIETNGSQTDTQRIRRATRLYREGRLDRIQELTDAGELIKEYRYEYGPGGQLKKISLMEYNPTGESFEWMSSMEFIKVERGTEGQAKYTEMLATFANGKIIKIEASYSGNDITYLKTFEPMPYVLLSEGWYSYEEALNPMRLTGEVHMWISPENFSEHVLINRREKNYSGLPAQVELHYGTEGLNDNFPLLRIGVSVTAREQIVFAYGYQN